VRIRVGYEMIHDFPQPTPMIMVLGVHFTRARHRRLPRWWISVLERDPGLRRKKGPAGCHHSRFNLQANKQPINQSVNCSDMAILNRYRQRCGGRRGGRVINNANARPIAPAINMEPSGLSCTFFAIACEPSRKVSPLCS
jgi:hypothetical protein